MFRYTLLYYSIHIEILSVSDNAGQLTANHKHLRMLERRSKALDCNSNIKKGLILGSRVTNHERLDFEQAKHSALVVN